MEIMMIEMIQVHSFQKSLLKVFGRSASHLCSFLLISCSICGIDSSTFFKNSSSFMPFLFILLYICRAILRSCRRDALSLGSETDSRKLPSSTFICAAFFLSKNECLFLLYYVRVNRNVTVLYR